ncbi:MAG: hypothetical protein ACI955_002925 [Zhongshania sp.]|jgi:hypothetical protein
MNQYQRDKDGAYTLDFTIKLFKSLVNLRFYPIA